MKSLAKTFAYGSAVLAVVIASSLSGCSSSDSKDTGTAGSGGSGTGGTSGGSTGGTSSAGHAGTSNGTGGSAIGAAGADTTGMGGSGGSDTTGTAGADTMGNAGADTGAAGATATGAAVGKFCNTVQFGTQADPMDITLRLEIGTAPNVVTIEALSGTCVPTTGACKSLPLGTDVPVKLIDPAASNAVLDSATVTISDGDEFVFYSDIDTDAPVIRGGTLDTAQGTCSDFQYSQL